MNVGFHNAAPSVREAAAVPERRAEGIREISLCCIAAEPVTLSTEGWSDEV
jgi:hypothetical protein